MQMYFRKGDIILAKGFCKLSREKQSVSVIYNRNVQLVHAFYGIERFYKFLWYKSAKLDQVPTMTPGSRSGYAV